MGEMQRKLIQPIGNEMLNYFESMGFTKVEAISAGASEDKKYYVETRKGESLLARASPILNKPKKIANMLSQFEMMQHLAAAGVSMSELTRFYILDKSKLLHYYKWCNGVVLYRQVKNDNVIDDEKYKLGVKMGEITKNIHTVSVEKQSNIFKTMKNKVDRELKAYSKSNIRSLVSDNLISFISNHNIDFLKDRPVSLIHGDLNMSNAILNDKGEIFIIDWEQICYGDPLFDLAKVELNVGINSHFGTGMMNGYLKEDFVDDFSLTTFRFYFAFKMLNGLRFYLKREKRNRIKIAYRSLNWFDSHYGLKEFNFSAELLNELDKLKSE